MAKDFSLPVRKAIVTFCRSAPEVAAIIGARFYGPDVPAMPVWPYAFCGLPSSIPARAQCMDGSDISVVIHAFARGPGEDACSILASHIAASLDLKALPLAGATAHVNWAQTQILRDTDEANAYHAIIRLDIRVSS